LLEDARPLLPDIPTDRLIPIDLGTPATLEEVRLALIAFLEAGAGASAMMTVEDLP
jgi:hypothetical protein